MFRTVIEAHEDFDRFTDRPGAPRFSDADRDRYLNLSQDAIIQDRYDAFREQKNYSFQSVQRVRDELSSLVAEAVVLAAISPGSSTYAYPSNYRHALLLRTTIDAYVKAAPPTTYDALEVEEDDPFDNATPEYPKSIEHSGGIRIIHGTTGTITKVELFYLKNPVIITLTGGITSQLPGHLHDEWIEFAAMKAMGMVEDYNKYQLLKTESKES